MTNVVLLMSDEHNPFYSSPYGHGGVRTPNMQRMAEAGTVFENAYCPSPLCMPSRSAFLAGRRVHELQTYSNCSVNVDPTPVSFGAALAGLGVHSAYVGKTDVYAPGDDLGFSTMMLPGDRKPPGDVNHRRNPMTVRTGSAGRADGYGPRENAGARDSKCVDEGVRWLKDVAPGLDGPWALTVNVTAPHFPHFAPPEFWEAHAGTEDLPARGAECESANHPYALALREHFETAGFSDEQVRGLRLGYLACISFVDHGLGRLMAALEEAGLSEGTNVIYTSDHGDMLGKFGMWWKCSLYEDSVRVPCFACGPDFESGARVTTPVDLHDVRAAIFASTGVEQPESWLGTPLQQIPQRDDGRAVFAEYHGHGARGSSFMVRRGRWKYLHYTGAACQLFDLADDPEELQDLAESEPQVRSDMDEALRAVCTPELENDRAEAFIEGQLAAIRRDGDESS